MEDYIPKLQIISKLLLEIDVDTIDAQEMDYISEIEDYVRYVSFKYEGCNIEPPIVYFLKKGIE
jgi:hypothetical protein